MWSDQGRTVRHATFGLLCLGFGLSASAGTLVVNDTGDAGPGDCAATCTLRDALASAAPGDNITFSPALSYPATITLSGQELLIYKSLTIAGPGLDRLTVSGGNQSRVFEIANSATVTIQDLAIADGNESGANGAPDFSGTTPPGNGGDAAGGAIYVNSGRSLLLADCDIHHNGGAGGPEISPGCSFAAGRGGSAAGGALYTAGDVIVRNCTFRSNQAAGGAGGDNLCISASAAGGAGGDAVGGAIAASGQVELSNVTLAGNSAGGGSGGNGPYGGAGGNARGGALSLDGFSVLEFVSSAGNTTSGSGGGFGTPPGPPGSATASDALIGATVVARSSVLASTQTPSCQVDAGGIYAEGANLDRDGSCPGFTLHADPKLAPLGANVGGRYVMFPRPGRPLIDAALDCQDAFGGTVTTDELATPRPQGARCDLGAVESDRLFGDGFDGS